MRQREPASTDEKCSMRFKMGIVSHRRNQWRVIMTRASVWNVKRRFRVEYLEDRIAPGVGTHAQDPRFQRRVLGTLRGRMHCTDHQHQSTNFQLQLPVARARG